MGRITISAMMCSLGNGIKCGMRRIRPYLASLLALLLVSGGFFSFAPRLFAQEPNRVALVVVHGDGREVKQCVVFTERELTGYDVLQRSGLQLNIDIISMGPAVCSLDGEGCNAPQEDCFCGMNQTPPRYWTYWQLEDNAWKYANIGAGGLVVKSGEVQGWKWGTGDAKDAAPPTAYTFEEICVPAEAEPTATLTPLPSPTYPPTATDAPSSTPTVSPTPTPSFTPSYTPFPTATPTFPLPTSTATWTPTSTWTPSITPTMWTTEAGNNQASPLETPTPIFTPENGAVAAQPNTVQGYALRLPVVQAPLPTVAAVEAVTVAEVATELPVATLEPTTTPLLTDTPLPTPTPEVVAIVATDVPTDVPTALPETPTEIPAVTVVIVVTTEAVTQEMAPMPTLLPAVATPAPTIDPQLNTLLTMLVGAGMLVVLPMGLIVVAGLAYWIGRKL